MSKSIPEQYQHLRTFAFGDSPELADELLELVVKGIKTATCSTEDEPNTSTPGERWVVLDGRGEPRCVIETAEVAYRRFNEVDATFAYDEGEGDRSRSCASAFAWSRSSIPKHSRCQLGQLRLTAPGSDGP